MRTLKPSWVKRHKDLGIALGIYVLFGIGALFVWNSHPAYIPVSSSSSEMAVPNLAPSGRLPKKVLLSIGGAGNQNTKLFKTTGKWAITYSSYNCRGLTDMLPSWSLGSSKFTYSVENVDGTVDTDYIAAKSVSNDGVTTDYYSDAGQHYLAIKSDCNWTVSVYQ